jgi:release factor glutamine methyltransferase
MPTIAELLADARAQLGGDEADKEAQLLLEDACGISRSERYTHPQRVVEADQVARFYDWLQRRISGEPLAYITGRRAFWDLELDITPGVLIPRVDTETLVEQALQRIPPQAEWQIADLGTGSGAIALVLARERPQCKIVAVDVSVVALSVAADNARQLGLGNIEFIEGHWLRPVAGKCFDMIVSNPPYIESGDPHLLQGDLPHEPDIALASGSDGLDAIREIIDSGREHLRSAGWLLLEHGYKQGPAVRDLLNRHDYREIFTVSDLAGNNRVSGARK